MIINKRWPSRFMLPALDSLERLKCTSASGYIFPRSFFACNIVLNTGAWLSYIGLSTMPYPRVLLFDYYSRCLTVERTSNKMVITHGIVVLE